MSQTRSQTQQNQAHSCKTIFMYTMTRKSTPTFGNIKQHPQGSRPGEGQITRGFLPGGGGGANPWGSQIPAILILKYEAFYAKMITIMI